MPAKKAGGQAPKTPKPAAPAPKALPKALPPTNVHPFAGIPLTGGTEVIKGLTQRPEQVARQAPPEKGSGKKG